MTAQKIILPLQTKMGTGKYGVLTILLLKISLPLIRQQSVYPQQSTDRQNIVCHRQAVGLVGEHVGW